MSKYINGHLFSKLHHSFIFVHLLIWVYHNICSMLVTSCPISIYLPLMHQHKGILQKLIYFRPCIPQYLAYEEITLAQNHPLPMTETWAPLCETLHRDNHSKNIMYTLYITQRPRRLTPDVITCLYVERYIPHRQS